MNRQVNSIAIYGSRARNDFDTHSDNDLLIVADQFENKFEMEQSFNNLGYSCAAYTFNKLQTLSDRKALFIQHLKQDAKIIQDNDNRLKEMLSQFVPKANYNTEITEAVSYFNLLRVIPNTIEGIGWAFDIIAIGLRNYNILQLANYKIYEFSLPIILKCSQRLFNLTDLEIDSLVNTRIAKKNYRTRQYDLLPSKSELIDTIKIIEKRYSFSINTTFMDKDYFNQYALTNLYSNNSLTAYQKLRLFEGFVFTSTLSLDISVREKCRRIIENPKFYAMDFQNQEFIDNLLIEILL